MEKVYPVSAPTIARVMDNDAIDLERYPSTKKDAPTSSSESSPAVGSVSETPSRFQRLASSFQRRRCQRNGYAPTGPRPSIYSRIKRCLTFNRRDNAHLFRTRFSKFRENYSLFIVLFVLWATFNILGALWHYHYVQASTHPYNYRGLINNSSGWSAFTASMFIFGFILMYPNAIAGMVLIAFPFTMLKSRRQSSAPAKTMHSLVSFAVIAFACLCIASGIFVTIEPFFGPFATVPIAWSTTFRGTCNGFGIRVWLDSKGQVTKSTLISDITVDNGTVSTPARSVEFKQFEPLSTYRMEFKPDPQETNDYYNVFSLDPGYIPTTGQFVISYDSIHYNFTDYTYSTKRANQTIHQGNFELRPRLRIPDLHLEADITDFARSDKFDAFVKVYSTADDDAVVDKKRAWSDNTDVMMRTARFSHNDRLQVCTRSMSDAMKGLGDMTPVPVGLLILVRAGRKIVWPDSSD